MVDPALKSNGRGCFPLGILEEANQSVLAAYGKLQFGNGSVFFPDGKPLAVNGRLFAIHGRPFTIHGRPFAGNFFVILR